MKTIKIDELKEFINDYLLNSSDSCKEQREAYSKLMEHFLFKTNNYCGYNYLTEEMISDSDNKNNSPGIRFYHNSLLTEDKVFDRKVQNEKFEIIDHTRIFFY
jgi:hypothetical protein